MAWKIGMLLISYWLQFVLKRVEYERYRENSEQSDLNISRW